MRKVQELKGRETRETESQTEGHENSNDESDEDDGDGDDSDEDEDESDENHEDDEVEDSHENDNEDNPEDNNEEISDGNHKHVETDQADEPETNAQYLSGNIQLDQQEDQQKDQQQQQIQGEQVEIQARNGEDERSMTFQTLSIKTKIQSFSAKIEELRSSADKDRKVDFFYKLLKKSMQKAYCLWSLAELTKNKEYFKDFIHFVTEVHCYGPDGINCCILLSNEMSVSKNLVYYLIMALVHLDKIKEAYGTLKFWFLNWDNDKKLKEASRNLWLHFPIADPKENISNFDEIAKNSGSNGSHIRFLLASLIAIKTKVIQEMKECLNHRKMFVDAFEANEESAIAFAKKKYPDFPDLNQAKLSDINRFFLGGKNKSTYSKELDEQINQLKTYISLCWGKSSNKKWHPLLISEVLCSKTGRFHKIHEYHLSKGIHCQSRKFASLGSCALFFETIFDSEHYREVTEIIKSEIDTLEVENTNQQFPPNVSGRKRKYVPSYSEERNQNEPGGKRSALDDEVSSTCNEPPPSDFQFDSSNFTFDSDRNGVKVEPKNTQTS